MIHFKEDMTHISIILDRTGSMEDIREDTIGGFNTFLKEQQALPDEATLSLIQFDSQNPYEVIHHFEKIKDVPKLTPQTYVPRASTPLLDAIGRGINDLESALDKMRLTKRPANVVMVIITDGQENSSREFSKNQIVKMIKAKQEKGWQFVYLSADLGSINDAKEYGMHAHATMAFAKSHVGTRKMWSSSSKALARLRTKKSKSIFFDKEDRADEPKPWSK